MENAYAQVDTRSLVMYVDGSLAPTQIADSILHEIFHIIYSSFALPSGTKLTEEVICRLYPGAIIEIMRDNPELFRWIRKVTK